MITVIWPRSIVATALSCVAALFPVSGSMAGPPASPSAAMSIAVDGSAILMGVAAAASVQTVPQQDADRDALKKRLRWLLDNNVRPFLKFGADDQQPRIVRVLFDVDAQGRATNVRVGKRSGNPTADRAARMMVTGFKIMPGGERRRVCILTQYSRIGQDPADIGLKKSLKDETDLAIVDMIAGRDGPTYDRHGRIVA